MTDKEGEVKAPIERERKWEVIEVPEDLEKYPHTEISQGYLAITADKTEVRLRDKDGKYTQTVKIGQGEVRGEYEAKLTQEQFDAFWPATAERRLEKTRYEIPVEGGKVELDVYKGKLAGFISAEVEFSTEAASVAFQAPSWFGRELTTDPAYKNQSLATQGLPPQS